MPARSFILNVGRVLWNPYKGLVGILREGEKTWKGIKDPTLLGFLLGDVVL